MLKFVKGKFKVQDNEVPLGTQYIAHANQLTFCWIKFRDKKVVDRKFGKAIDRWRPPERDELDDGDQSQWETGLDGKPKDPWVFQRLLPFEHLESGEVVIFVTSSTGGKIACDELVREYARRVKRTGSRALPIVALRSKDMPTTYYGPVPRPYFEVVGHEDTDGKGVEVDFGKDKGPISDSIPF